MYVDDRINFERRKDKRPRDKIKPGRMFAAVFALGIAGIGVANTTATVSALTGGSTVYLPDGEYTLGTTGGRYLTENDNYNADLRTEDRATVFKLTRGADGYYTLISKRSGKALDVAAASTSPGANVQTYKANGSCAQKWAIDLIRDSMYALRSACSGNALDIRNGQVNRSTTNVQTWTPNGSAAQTWILNLKNDAHTIADGLYQVYTPSTKGRLLDVAAGSLENGANIQIWKENGSGAQYFWVSIFSDGSYQFVNPQSGKALDVEAASSASGANVHTWARNGSCAQKWFKEWKSGDKYTFVNACSGKALDVSAGKIGNIGANVQIWDKNGTEAQQWTLKK